jgi:uncharacterized membrane protein
MDAAKRAKISAAAAGVNCFWTRAAFALAVCPPRPGGADAEAARFAGTSPAFGRFSDGLRIENGMDYIRGMPENDAPSEHGHSCPEFLSPSIFSAILLPHRSLSGKGFLTLIAIIGGVSFICGVFFAVIGAWPVFAFFGLDAVCLYFAFRINYRDARMFEQVDLSERELRITRVDPWGQAQSWSFNPFWVRLELQECENGADVLSLSSHGRRLIFGAFLSDPEKKDFAAALRRALASQRTAIA